MKGNWTQEQQKIISLRNRNLFVSASAGAGKTATLVARICSLLKEGVKVSSLLILTFTKAAAAEMRKRVREELERMVLEEEASEHIRKQLSLLPDALITTIHSFCQIVLRDYFHCIDLDPGFRIAEEAELTLLRFDVLAEMLEAKYEEGEEDFLEFMECYAGGKSEAIVEELILKLYDLSRGCPFPEEWLEEQKQPYFLESLSELDEQPIFKRFCNYLNDVLEEAVYSNEQAIAICTQPEGPAAYLDALLDDQDKLALLRRSSCYTEYAQQFFSFSFLALSRKKQPEASEEKKEAVKAKRQQVKDLIGRLKKDFFFQSPEEMLSDLQDTKYTADVFLKLVLEFSERYAKKKQEKNILDFSDLEHLTLKIVVERKEKESIPTKAAEELSKKYIEIMLDEYQDTNLVQEMILTSISRERFGTPNRFMVGDVKQSIYKFRLAKPELFLEKQERYSEEESLYQKVLLQTNYRSRKEVLFSINYLFESIMVKKLGGIFYDEEAELRAGASYLELGLPDQNKTELILVLREEEDPEKNEVEMEELEEFFEDEEEETNLKELEARAAAKRILALVGEEGILLQEGKTGRKAEFSDIVILLRAMSGWLSIFTRVLEEEGIPVYCDQQTGYFAALEIRTILNYLRILDNPRQDIPFTSILHSDIVDLDTEKLAKIRLFYRVRVLEDKKSYRPSFYEAARYYAEQEDTEEEIRQKLCSFFLCYDNLREMVMHLGIVELIQRVLEETNYLSFVSAMVQGERRRGNLEMLLEQAAAFEAGSYSGLFQFIRYMERLIQKNVDYGESLRYDGSNAVRITSIHKSKGLEYPIVLLAGLNKPMNHQDIREKIVLHSEYGFGMEYIDYRNRIRLETLQKKVLQRFLVLENIAEEQRILYVAMTRAKEKLILLGSLKNLEKQKKKYLTVQTPLSFRYLSEAKSYLDYVGAVLLCGTSLSSLDTEFTHFSGLFSISFWKESDLKVQIRTEQEELPEVKQVLIPSESVIRRSLKEALAFSYAFFESFSLPFKISVSELKKKSQLAEIEESGIFFPDFAEDEPKTIPKFLKLELPIRQVDLGTVYHKVLEHISFDCCKEKGKLKEILEHLKIEGTFQEQELKMLNKKKLELFFASELAARMYEAEKKGCLYREQPFVMGVPYKDIDPNYSGSEETVLIQGMIDIYFEEAEGLVLLDYKTDYVNKSQENLLIARYQLQFAYYAKALEQMTGKQVKEKLIYSFGLSKVIKIP